MKQGQVITLGHANIGVSIHHFLTATSPALLPELTNLLANESYILHLSTITSSSGSGSAKEKWEVNILLKQSCTPRSQLKAWMHGLLAARCMSLSLGESKVGGYDSDRVLQVLGQTLKFLNHGDRFEGYMLALQECGWDVDVAALETRSGRRVSLA